jgi:predicted dehydrogenase
MRKMKQMVDSGRVGEIYRVSMTCSNWYRTQAYYDSGAWRGTWDGEGGGIMLNQAPHSLDLYQWIGGMPKRIMAIVGRRLHRIEVENVAQVICDYGRGKTGSIYLTSAEVPGVEQLQVVGDKGTLIYEDGGLRFGKLSQPISRHIFECKEPGADDIIPPRCTWKEVKVQDTGGSHGDVIGALAGNVLRGRALVAPGDEAINELEISNAVYLSGYTGRAVDLPVDAAQMERLLRRLARRRGAPKITGMRQAAARELKKLLKR